MGLEPDTVVGPNPDAIAERLGDETVVLEPVSDRYVRLNSTGTFLWEELAQGASAASLAGKLRGRFGLDEQRSLDDAAAFLHDLDARDLIVVRG